MRNLFILVALVLFAAVPAVAQEVPKAEIGGNYTYIHLDTGSSNGTHSCHGGGGSATYNLTSYLGVAAEFSGCKVTGLPSGVSASAFSYLFGPRVTYRGYGRLEPFGEFLFGGAHDSITGPNPTPPPANVTFTDNAFSFALGGGADYKLTDSFAIRFIQADYLYTKFGNTHQNNARIQAGIVYRWGAR
jgi:opacity protein-like surface antigen